MSRYKIFVEQYENMAYYKKNLEKQFELSS